MPIKTSSARQIDLLVADLGSDQKPRRHTAIARLTVFGSRAVARLIECLESTASPETRIGALRTLEAIGDPRALRQSSAALNDSDPAVASAAIATVRTFLRSAQGAQAVDGLATVALDRTRPESVRVSAIEALVDLKRSTVALLVKALRHDPSPAIRAAAGLGPAEKGSTASPLLDQLNRAAEEGLPDDPLDLRHTIGCVAAIAPLPVLLRVVERVREREQEEQGTRRMEWLAVRGAAHAALARRGSRIGVYDLRETIESAEVGLPVDFLAALEAAGDRSCLEAMAVAYERSRDAWWRDHLADAFRTIVRREGITRRHAIVKKIEKRSRTLLESLWPNGSGKPRSRADKSPGRS